MNLKKMTFHDIASYLLKEQNNHPSFSFYAEFDERTGSFAWEYEIAVVKFADANMVLGNYWGGGSPFCYDLTGDSGESGLESAFAPWFRNEVGSDVVWVEQSRMKTNDDCQLAIVLFEQETKLCNFEK